MFLESQATLVVHQPNSPVIRSSIIASPQTQQPMSSPNQTVVAQPQPSVIAKHAQQQANQVILYRFTIYFSILIFK